MGRSTSRRGNGGEPSDPLKVVFEVREVLGIERDEYKL